jgi:hypothetical protein
LDLLTRSCKVPSHRSGAFADAAADFELDCTDCSAAVDADIESVVKYEPSDVGHSRQFALASLADGSKIEFAGAGDFDYDESYAWEVVTVVEAAAAAVVVVEAAAADACDFDEMKSRLN